MDVSMTIPMNNPMNTQKAKVISDINETLITVITT